MGRTVTSFSADDDVAEYLKQDHINMSGLINRLVRMHMNGGVDEDLMREFRMQQVRAELEDLEARAEKKRDQLEQLQEHDDRIRQEHQRNLDDALDELASIPPRHINPENPAVRNWADKLGMDPADLIDELDDSDDTQ